MKYLQKTTLCLAAIVLIALGNKAAASADVIDPTGTEVADATVYAGARIEINDAGANGTSAAILTGANTIDIDIKVGKIKVGDAAAIGAKLSTGANTVESGAILEITAATADCIPGDLEVKSGGILQVDDGVDVPDTGVFGSTLQVDSGAIIKLGAGSKWSKREYSSNCVTLKN